MIKLIIADDEPLVQAGIKSMVNWEELGISIVGTVANGSAAYELICEHQPEIVITDIKMPVMSGLELARKCHEEGRELPVFIILTSYEEFQFVKEALAYQVVNYLIKLELTPEVLTQALRQALAKVAELQKSMGQPSDSYNSLYLMKEQFYTRLIFNLFESEGQFHTQARNLKIRIDYPAYVAGYIEIKSEKLTHMSSDMQINLYASSLQVARELISKHCACHVLSLDTRHFCVIFFLSEDSRKDYRNMILETLTQVSVMLFNYYSVTIHASVGAPVSTLYQVSVSYQDARQIFSRANADTPILFLEDVTDNAPLKNVFNFSLFRNDIRKAYDEFDEKALYDIFTSIIELFDAQQTHYVQALDAAGNILYLSLSLLTNGEQIVSEIFRDRSNGYRCLYELSTVPQILEWLRVLRDGLCADFAAQNKDYKNHIVVNVKRYISEHVREKLTLNKVAEAFNISPNYLSVLFSKYNEIGFSDYINQRKVEEAKKMMRDGDLKIYEISDLLGFESAFYFSRVFKKMTGISPRDYINSSHIPTLS